MHRDHLSHSQWKAYRERALPAADLLAVSDHLAACPACAAQRGPWVWPTETAGDEWPSSDPYESVAAWVDGTMTDPVDREVFEARLRLEPRLAAEVADLAAFKQELARLPAHEHRAAPNVVPFRRPAMGRWLLPLAAAATLMLTIFLWNATLTAPRANVAAARVMLPPLAPELRTVRGTLAGSADAPTLQTAPATGPIVRDRRPRLEWRSAAAADGYIVQVERLSDGTLISSPALPATARSWQPAEPLAPGAIYEWQVRAVRGGLTVDQAPKPPEPEARFQVLSDEAERKLRAVEQDAARSELTLGWACAEAGLTADAEAHWTAAGAAGTGLRTKLRDAAKQAGYLR